MAFLVRSQNNFMGHAIEIFRVGHSDKQIKAFRDLLRSRNQAMRTGLNLTLSQAGIIEKVDPFILGQMK